MEINKTFKKGQRVFVASTDERVNSFDAVVISVGKKFVTVSTNLENPSYGRKYKFNIEENLRCEEWVVYELYVNEDDFHHKREMEEKINFIISNISSRWVFEEMFSEEEINALYNRLKEKYGK